MFSNAAYKLYFKPALRQVAEAELGLKLIFQAGNAGVVFVVAFKDVFVLNRHFRFFGYIKPDPRPTSMPLKTYLSSRQCA